MGWQLYICDSLSMLFLPLLSTLPNPWAFPHEENGASVEAFVCTYPSGSFET